MGIVYASTIGLEMAATGKPVLCVAQATYSHTGCVRQIDTPDALEPALREALEQAPSIEIARTALRWTFRYFEEYSIPFDLVKEEPNYEASLAYSDLGALLPGQHPVLDAICALLRGTAPGVLADPTKRELERPTSEEDIFLDQWLCRVQIVNEGTAATAQAHPPVSAAPSTRGQA